MDSALTFNTILAKDISAAYSMCLLKGAPPAQGGSWTYRVASPTSTSIQTRVSEDGDASMSSEYPFYNRTDDDMAKTLHSPLPMAFMDIGPTTSVSQPHHGNLSFPASSNLGYPSPAGSSLRVEAPVPIRAIDVHQLATNIRQAMSRPPGTPPRTFAQLGSWLAAQSCVPDATRADCCQAEPPHLGLDLSLVGSHPNSIGRSPHPAHPSVLPSDANDYFSPQVEQDCGWFWPQSMPPSEPQVRLTVSTVPLPQSNSAMDYREDGRFNSPSSSETSIHPLDYSDFTATTSASAVPVAAPMWHGGQRRSSLSSPVTSLVDLMEVVACDPSPTCAQGTSNWPAPRNSPAEPNPHSGIVTAAIQVASGKKVLRRSPRLRDRYVSGRTPPTGQAGKSILRRSQRLQALRNASRSKEAACRTNRTRTVRKMGKGSCEA